MSRCSVRCAPLFGSCNHADPHSRRPLTGAVQVAVGQNLRTGSSIRSSEHSLAWRPSENLRTGRSTRSSERSLA